MNWRQNAACKGHHITEFFPSKTMAAAAKKRVTELCRLCPVWPECLAFALDRPCGDDDGIYAATNPTDRDRLRSKT